MEVNAQVGRLHLWPLVLRILPVVIYKAYLLALIFQRDPLTVPMVRAGLVEAP